MTTGQLRRALRRQFGFDEFRTHQLEVVQATVAGRDVFAALPTGGGKSLCYQLPATLVEGLTVVVSPLIALMQDQVDGAVQDGVRAAYLNSSMDAEANRKAWLELSRGEVDLLYVSPERLSNPEFRSRLREWNLTGIAVDEAHCISEWGHEFRQDYRNLAVLREEYPQVPIAAFTATATRAVQRDVVEQLSLQDPLVVRAGFDRPEISYRVEPRRHDTRQIVEFVTARTGSAGIVYRATRKAVEQTASQLVEAGISAVPYHAGLDAETRRRRQREFVNDEVDVVVATIAFGMGIDKSNVRWIVHGDLPRSLEAYYQETGRAGRDGESAEALLLHSPKDLATIRWHIGNMEQERERERAERNLREVLSYVESGACRRQRLLAHFDEEHPGNCGSCDVCLGEVSLEDVTVPAQKLLSAVIRTGERFGAHHLVDILLGEYTDRVEQLGHHQLPTFGVGQERRRTWWLSFARELESSGYLERQKIEGQTRPGGFRLTDSGRQVLGGRQTVVSAATAEREAVGSGARRRRGDPSRAAESSTDVPAGTPSDATAVPLRADQQRLFEQLRLLRKELARARSVPPYVILSDKSLKVIARNRPTDRAALLRCHGIGEAKLEQFGDELLQTIRSALGDPGEIG